MKSALKIAVCLCITLIAFNNIKAQEVASLNTYSPAKALEEKPSAPAANTEMTITLKNAAEKSIAIFAGPKEEIRDPKLKTVGGLSKNTLYLQVNDVVCLMTPDKRPVSCASIKPGMTAVEVNTSATTISGK